MVTGGVYVDGRYICIQVSLIWYVSSELKCGLYLILIPLAAETEVTSSRKTSCLSDG